MKLFRTIFPAVVALFLLAGVFSCKKNIVVTNGPFSTPLQALINSDTSLSVYYAAVKKANDNGLYAGIDSMIVLIPGDSAFAAKGITVSTINAMSVAGADSLLRYHLIPGPVVLTSGVYTPFTNKLGSKVYGYGDFDSSGNYFNGIHAVFQKLPGSNATVYTLDAPLSMPAVGAGPLIASDSSLILFAEAVKHTGINLTPSSGWNTILAPVNTAFAAAGYNSIADIDNADIATLTNVLQYHIVPGQYFADSLARTATVTSLQGKNIAVSFSNNTLQFTGANNMATAVTTNKIAGNNIILHTISAVLMP